MRDSEIILCKGIKMDKNYENVLSYSESDMVSLCRSNSVYTATNTSILGAKADSIDISVTYAVAMYANYMAFKNPTYGNKWIFAFITDVKYLSDSACRIFYQIDVWSTWYSSFHIGKAFVEREHVDDDTVGKHTVPEGLETGEYISQMSNNSSYQPVLTNMYYLSSVYIIVGVTTLGFTYAIPQNAQSNEYNGVYSGLRYLAFDSAQDLEKYIKNSQENLSSDNIATIFVSPAKLTGIENSDWITTSVSGDIHYSFKFAFVPTTTSEKDMGSFSFPKAAFLDSDYIPTNKKLLTFPFCFLNVTNNSGITKDYHYELFNTANNCTFELRGTIGVGCSIKAYPIDYAIKGSYSSTVENKLHSIDGGKLPTCGWLNDAYTNWLTSNSVNIGLNVANDLFNGAANIVSGNVVGGLSTGFGGILSNVASVYQHSLQPPSAKGGINQGDLNFAQRFTFNTYPMSIKKEYAKVIDGYFSRFGYKVNEVKQPNLKTRTKFNFIKIGGKDDLVDGDIPAVALSEINDIFRKGVTIFHNYSDFGNYTISNPIRSS